MWRWKKYVPVAARKAKAKRQLERFKKRGVKVEPVEIQGRTIARNFWGKGWCEHLEGFSDFENRLPRGRSYARNGSVCHLTIKRGHVEALVIGSKLYQVKVVIPLLEKRRWDLIKKKCSGQIGSVLEILKGQLSDHIMQLVADHEEGLFPNADEIEFSCDCPDWAGMCKHVAAVLYGVGSRLDDAPHLLFLLRGVDPSELVAANLEAPKAETADLLDTHALADLFGIDLETSPQPLKNEEGKLTGCQLQEMRKHLYLTVAEMADELEVTPASIYRWEKTKEPLKLQPRNSQALKRFLKKWNP